jgi:hypothetical protein
MQKSFYPCSKDSSFEIETLHTVETNIWFLRKWISKYFNIFKLGFFKNMYIE